MCCFVFLLCLDLKCRTVQDAVLVTFICEANTSTFLALTLLFYIIFVYLFALIIREHSKRYSGLSSMLANSFDLDHNAVGFPAGVFLVQNAWKSLNRNVTVEDSIIS